MNDRAPAADLVQVERRSLSGFPGYRLFSSALPAAFIVAPDVGSSV